MKSSLFLVALFIVSGASLYAQSVGPATLNATGGSTTIGSGEYEWSVGEMTMVNTFVSSGITVTQGVLQPDDQVEGVTNTTALLQQLRVFPNPATSDVNLQYSSSTDGKLEYRLMDIAGRIIKDQAVSYKQGTTTEQINLSGLASATYMLEVTINTGASSQKASYKIDKQ